MPGAPAGDIVDFERHRRLQTVRPCSVGLQSADGAASTSWWWGAGPPACRSATSSPSLGIDHVVLERGRIGQTWRDRWDSFCLVTPNWSVRLPGGTYAGDDPDGFMPRDEIVAHLERYAATSGAPVREGVAVRTIDRAPGGFVARTSAGDLHAARVVLGTGAFQRAHRPAGADSLPAGLLQIDIEDYPERGRPATGAGPGRRQRAVGLPAGRGAAGGRPRGRPLVREGPVGAAPAGRPRPRLVAGGVGLPRPAGLDPAVARRPPRSRTRGDAATAAATTWTSGRSGRWG